MARLPRVALFTLGGTIASTAAAGSSGVRPNLDADGLLAATPELQDIAEITSTAFRTLPSPDLRLQDIIELTDAIETAIESGIDGVVVSQGTDTLEETAFALSCLLKSSSPVAVTGAMRNPTQIAGDGPANLLSAVSVVTSPLADNLGCTVVFNEEIHDPVFVRKGHSSNLSAFTSPRSGPIGWLSEGRVELITRPRRTVPLAAESSRVSDVAWLSMGMGTDSRLIRSVGDLGYAGAVIDGVGGGHVPGELAEPIGDLARLIPVVLASRTHAGSVLRETYGFKGGEIDLLERGVIPAGVLDGSKARILLMLLVASGFSRDALRREFALRAELNRSRA